MSTVLSITFIITLFALAVFQMFRNRRNSGYVDVKSVVMPRILCLILMMAILGMVSGPGNTSRLLFDVMVAVISLLPIVLSLRPVGKLPMHVGSIPVMIPLISVYYLICSVGLMTLPAQSCFMALSGLLAIFFSLIYIWMIWKRLHDVKSVMKSGNVWSFVTLCVDFIYVLTPMLVISSVFVLYVIFPSRPEIPLPAAVVFLILELVAVAVRVSGSSAFVILHDHERLIVESMKISHMDASAPSDPRGEEQYKELYERIVLYFEMSKPYLDGNLTINDIAKVVYSNKVYISKAICHYTGRNFRQFVNYHRIIYSMSIFRENPEMKVSELSERCGFNTIVSFTMAFRLFMNETPSEWCRKERSKILKPKK